MKTVVLGAGELGGRVLAHVRGPRVAVTSTPARHPALRARGAEPTCVWPSPSSGEHWVLALPGSARQRAAVRRVQDLGTPDWAVLVSTVGLHRPYRGTVTPDSPPGDGDRAASAREAEEAFRAWVGARGTIVRCGGLWRVGRGPGAAFARKGTAPTGPEQATLPLVHYDDAATLVARALERRVEGVLLAVTAAPTRREFYTHVARLAGAAVPPFDGIGAPARFSDPRADQLLGAPTHPDWRAMEPLVD